MKKLFLLLASVSCLNAANPSFSSFTTDQFNNTAPNISIKDNALVGGFTSDGLFQFTGTDHAGIRLNNLTTAQKNALTPATGMIVFDTDLARFQFYNGSAWVSMVRTTGDTMTGTLTVPQVTLGTSGNLIGGVNTVEQYNSTSAQTFNVYNTRSSATSFELGSIRWAANIMEVGPFFGSAGGSARALRVGTTATAGATSLSSYLEFLPGSTPFIAFQRDSVLTGNYFSLMGTRTAASGAANAMFAIAPTYNMSGTAAATDLLINRTETAVGSGTQYLIDAQVGGSSRFSVANSGEVTVGAGGVNGNGAGFKHGRVTTGSITAGASANVTLTWTSAFADANYTVSASVEDSTAATASLSVVHVESKIAASVTVRVLNSAAGDLTGTLNVIAIHD